MTDIEIELPADVIARLQELADAEGVDLNTFMVEIVSTDANRVLNRADGYFCPAHSDNVRVGPQNCWCGIRMVPWGR